MERVSEGEAARINGSLLKVTADDYKEDSYKVTNLDNKENDWNYYALFGPKGVKWNFDGNTDSLTKVFKYLLISKFSGKTFAFLAASITSS